MLLLIPTPREARAILDGGRPPRCEDPETLELGGRPVRVALCGFGPAAAGALAALALARERPRKALLVGVAGAYDLSRTPRGSLFAANSVRFADLGSGRGAVRRSAQALGFEQAPPGPGRPAVGDALPVAVSPGAPALPVGGLLTVAAASGSLEEGRERARAFPEALGEDMEGFSVALAAQRLGIALSIVRGVSNLAGEEQREAWDLPGALSALRAWLLGGGLPAR